MKPEPLGQSQWVDIILPPAPQSDAWLWWLLGAVVVFIIGSVALFLWQRRPEQIARRKIRKLTKQLHHDQDDNKGLLKQLELLICERFAVATLSQVSLADKQWCAFRNQLVHACYQAQAPDTQQVQQLFSDARVYLKQSLSL